MIRIPHIYLKHLWTPSGRSVSRLIIAHPKSVQYIQHDPKHAELTIRYITGDEMKLTGHDKPQEIQDAFDQLVYQVKDVADS
jgi:hypothetical protein